MERKYLIIIIVLVVLSVLSLAGTITSGVFFGKYQGTGWRSELTSSVFGLLLFVTLALGGAAFFAGLMGTGKP